MRIEAYQHGIYPRSESVVAATRDLDRGRTTPDVVQLRLRDDRDDFVQAQRDAHLDYFSDGLLDWQDIFRPLVEASSSMQARALVRWFDTNSFYRAPELTGELRNGSPTQLLERQDGVPEPRAVTLPSPYLFSRAALGSGDRDTLMLELTLQILQPAVRDLVELGHRLVHLEEPWLVHFGIEAASWPSFERAIGLLREATGGAALVLHTYYGDAGPFADRLRRLPVDAVGIDFGETDLEALGTGWEAGVVAGCLDGRRSVLESVDTTVAFTEQVADALDPPALYLSSGTPLDLLPRDVARAKVLRLGEIADRVREVVR